MMIMQLVVLDEWEGEWTVQRGLSCCEGMDLNWLQQLELKLYTVVIVRVQAKMLSYWTGYKEWRVLDEY